MWRNRTKNMKLHWNTKQLITGLILSMVSGRQIRGASGPEAAKKYRKRRKAAFKVIIIKEVKFIRKWKHIFSFITIRSQWIRPQVISRTIHKIPILNRKLNPYIGKTSFLYEMRASIWKDLVFFVLIPLPSSGSSRNRASSVQPHSNRYCMRKIISCYKFIGWMGWTGRKDHDWQ